MGEGEVGESCVPFVCMKCSIVVFLERRGKRGEKGRFDA